MDKRSLSSEMICRLVTRSPLLGPLPPCFVPFTALRGPQHTSFNRSRRINSACDSLKKRVILALLAHRMGSHFKVAQGKVD